MANDDIDIIDPVFDTGKWRQEVYRLLKELREREAAGEIERKAHEAAMEELGKTMELTKLELIQWHRELQAMHGKPPSWVRSLWNAFWHGVGVTKAEGDKVFKE
jgi:hypothetical protein